MRFALLMVLLSWILSCDRWASTQSLPEGSFSRRHTLAVGAEYSNNSNHLLLGRSYNRRIGGIDVTYSHRLRHTRILEWHYDLEVRPVTFIQDPVSTTRQTVQFVGQPPFGPFVVQSGPIQSRCQSATITTNPSGASPPYTLVETRSCGSRWTYSGGLSPLGQRLNFAPGHRLQPFILGNAGFLVSPRDVPSDGSSRFNYTFEFGTGIEVNLDHRHAWAVDYRIHHLSNADLGAQNPGIDSQTVRVTYSFGS